MMENSTPPIHIIIDGQTEKNDIGLSDLLTIMRSTPRSPNIGWAVYVSENPLKRKSVILPMVVSVASTTSGCSDSSYNERPGWRLSS